MVDIYRGHGLRICSLFSKLWKLINLHHDMHIFSTHIMCRASKKTNLKKCFIFYMLLDQKMTSSYCNFKWLFNPQELRWLEVGLVMKPGA